MKKLVVAGLFLRLLGLINIRLGGDFALYWKAAGDIAAGKHFPLWGPVTSVNPSLHFSPLFYYFLTIPYLLGQGHYQVAIIFFAALNSLNIFLIYRVAKELFGKKTSYTIAILYTFSAFSISIDSFPWNYYVLPLLILTAIFFLIKIQKGQTVYLPVMFLILGIATQLHLVISLILPVFFLMLPLKRIRLKDWLISGFVLAVLLLPYLLQAGRVVDTFMPKAETCSFISWLQYHGHGERCFNQIRNTLFVFRFFSSSLFFTQNLLMAGLCFLLTVFMLMKKNLAQRKLFITWLGVPILALFIYSGGVHLPYFLIFFPIPFFLFALFLEELDKAGKWGKLTSRILFLSVLLTNILAYIASLSVPRI